MKSVHLFVIAAAAAFALSSCAVSPTPVADAFIDKVTSGGEDDVTRTACQEIGRNTQQANATIDELLANLGQSDAAVEEAAASGSDSGRALAAAWSDVYHAVAARDQEGMYAAMESVFAACRGAGVNMSWED